MRGKGRSPPPPPTFSPFFFFGVSGGYMDFLPRYFTSRALVGAFCLVFSSFAFSAVLDDPNYSWRLSSSGDVYRVYDPQGGRASSLFTPSSSFAEGSSGGVIETFAPPPLTIDGATGEVITSLSRSLTVGDLIDGLGHLMSVDNPVGLAILGATTVLPFAQSIYNNFESSLPDNSSSVSTPGTSQDPTFSEGCSADGYDTSSSPYGSVSLVYGLSSSSSILPLSSISVSGSSFTFTYQYSVNSSVSISCYGSPNVTPSMSSSSPPPSNLPQWISNNWSSDSLSNDASTALQNNPSFGPNLADQLANNATPLSSPVPYSYSPTSNTLSGSSTSTSSTNPSTGDTTTTTSTPSYKVSPGSHGGLSVQKSTTSVTQTCTSSGSCSTTNTSTSTSTPQPSSPFVAPTISTPTAPTASVKSFALSLSIPEQSVATCPKPLSISALSTTFYIPVTPLCNLATDVKPYVESLGAVGAGVVIFR